MKRTTKKLSGIGLELFLRRYYASYSGIDDTLARRLSEDSAKTFASIRVRRMAWRDWRGRKEPAKTVVFASMAKPAAIPVAKEAIVTAVNAPTVTDAAVFDPYAIGLIPTYQREGAEGLLLKLAAVASIDNLRKMARSQQVALPADLRGSDATIDDIRGAIVAAVGKRIADRRAAAG